MDNLVSNQTAIELNTNQSVIDDAIIALRKGELVAFPTETVYGLGADAGNEKALQKLFALKGRPNNHPVIVHLADFDQMEDWCIDLPSYAEHLAKSYWPGPLTLIVKKSKMVSDLVTGGQDTIGLRVPAHPIALTLLKKFAGGIAAPSANRYGRISATTSRHVKREFGNEVSVIINGGPCSVGIESTIVDITGKVPRVLRPGIISEKKILECIGLNEGAIKQENGVVPRVPGSDKSHYAPSMPLALVDRKTLIELATGGKRNGDLNLAVLAFPGLEQLIGTNFNANIRLHVQASEDPEIYARELYANLHRMDSAGVSKIYIEKVPDSPAWLAIADRLKRAESK